MVKLLDSGAQLPQFKSGMAPCNPCDTVTSVPQRGQLLDFCEQMYNTLA